MMKIDEFSRINFRIGKVESIKDEKAKISCCDKIFALNLDISDINIEEGDKIAVIINDDKIVIPLVGSSPLVPEKDVELGARIR